jgi:hypothetical protein
MSLFVIALAGPAGSGKSTVANYLRDAHGAQVFSFASSLKALARELFEFSDAQLYGTQAEKEAVDPRYGFSPRTAYQRLNAAKKYLGDDVYARALVTSLRKAEAAGVKLVVVDDLRFIIEADALRAAFDCEVWVCQNLGRETLAGSTHPSETEWAKIPLDRSAIFQKGEHAKLYATIAQWFHEASEKRKISLARSA